MTLEEIFPLFFLQFLIQPLTTSFRDAVMACVDNIMTVFVNH